MHNLKVKICGMRDPGNILEICALKPDYLGFIFYEKSPRFIGLADPEMLQCSACKGILKTGVFVNALPEFILNILSSWKLDLIQLHGDEKPRDVENLKEELPKGIKIIKAFGVDDNFDFTRLSEYDDLVDFFLFDTANSARGGSGKTFNHDLLFKYTGSKPYWLSGGLGLVEVSSIMETLDKYPPMLYGLDLNSRIELSPGLKDVRKAREIMAIV